MPIHRFLLSDFVSIQRQSFYSLLEKGLIEEFQKRNPITNVKKDFSLYFYPEYYILTKPLYSQREAIIKNKSYTSKLFVPVQINNQKEKKIVLKWVYIGNLPLMTKRGHFILNGAARVIVNQILRSPGIYYQQKIYENLTEKWGTVKPEDEYKRYYADLICLRGTWVRLEVDKEKNIWAQMKKLPKIPIYWFLLAMGLTEKVIFKTITEEYRLLGNIGEKKEKNANKPKKKMNEKEKEEKKTKKNSFAYLKNPPAAWKEIFTLIGGMKSEESETNKKKSSLNEKKTNSLTETSSTDDSKPSLKKNVSIYEDKSDQKKNAVILGRKWFYNRFMNPRAYDLGKQGRLAFNKKLGLNISLDHVSLTGLDVLYATDYLIKVEKGLYKIDDIDHLKNRRVRTSGELIQLQIGVGLVRLEKYIRDCINKPTLKSNALLNENETLNLSDKILLNNSSSSSVLLNNSLLTNMDNVHSMEMTLENSKKKKKQNKLDKSHSNKEGQSSKKGMKVKQILNTKTHSKLEKGETAHMLKPSKDLLGRLTQETLGSSKMKKSSLNLKNKMKSTRCPTDTDKCFSTYSALTRLRGFHPTSQSDSYYYLFNSKAFNSAIREFFGTSPLSQFMDQINPLAELTHKRRLSSMGPGGVTRDSATLAIRGIHPTHYGRICPIETPEGKNTGLVNSMTAYARINQNGIIESPFYKVYKGIVQNNLGMFYFSAEQEEKISLGAADLFTTPIGFLPKSMIPVRVGEDFTKMSRKKVQYVGVSPLQMISIATSLIPFLEHDDANRALMGSNMQRQAVPLIKPERPIVCTGLEARAVSDSGHVIQAQYSGLVTYVSSDQIIVISSTGLRH